MNEEWISVEQAAAMVCMSKATVYRMINEGVLPAYRPTPRRTRLKRAEVAAAFRPVRPVIVVSDELSVDCREPSVATAVKPSVREMTKAMRSAKGDKKHHPVNLGGAFLPE